MIRTKHVRAGKWRTLESFWNAKAVAFFRETNGAQIKVRYGIGWFGKDGQKQSLNGFDIKKLIVGIGSIAYARIQMKVPRDINVTYDIYPGTVTVTAPVAF